MNTPIILSYTTPQALCPIACLMSVEPCIMVSVIQQGSTPAPSPEGQDDCSLGLTQSPV